MKTKVCVVDYGLGNLLSVTRALEYCGAEVSLGDRPDDIKSAHRLVIPGVGAFGDGIEGLQVRNLVTSIQGCAREGRPILGICLGMQLMFEVGEEFGLNQGLGLIPGRVSPISAERADGGKRRIPHVGWSRLLRRAPNLQPSNEILGSLGDSPYAYFVHSFEGLPTNPDHLVASCDHDGYLVTAAVQSGSVYGCQFHPEKSGELGLEILARFLKV